MDLVPRRLGKSAGNVREEIGNFPGILWKTGKMTGITPAGCSGGRRGARVYRRDCDKICRLRTPSGRAICRPAFCQPCTSSEGRGRWHIRYYFIGGSRCYSSPCNPSREQRKRDSKENKKLRYVLPFYNLIKFIAYFGKSCNKYYIWHILVALYNYF